MNSGDINFPETVCINSSYVPADDNNNIYYYHNCDFYDYQELCHECKSGFVLNEDRNKCLKETNNIRNCRVVNDD